ncbi:patatin-like phospholipase domain-containing protein 2 isoform X2 [Scophthalmus maximus]|uniref:patatin-like phospholipase domain-containing protein 2 isoform X2 n=1 Tax=Scophthalmus maximus TaxID=52904 RepID=UPI0015E11E06|nr:patatin-like phospholipase domain-containing protein 2 isoform X2 [Scophthalmus maximus]
MNLRCLDTEPEKCCADLMGMARQARKHKLGPLHPAFNLLQMVLDALQRSLPEDAHVRASGRLCVSLTRVPDGKNVLVSEFDSREELIQTLLCSCFVPFYCGVVPPTYRGLHYVDGAISDNLPRCHLKNTITFSAYAGESDICPPASTLNLHEVRFNNVSIHVSSENMHRVASTFFPPEPEAMSQICQTGYVDALRFLQDNSLISSECPPRVLETDSPRVACCELLKERADAEESRENTQQNGLRPPQAEHLWLDPQLVERLPVHIRRALCEACRESHTTEGLLSHVADYLPKKVTSYLQIPRTLPVESAFSLANRLVDWIPDVPKDMSWLYGLAEDLYKQAWKDRVEDNDGESALRRCTSLPLVLNMCGEVDHMPLTPPPTPRWGATTESPTNAGGGWGLGRAVGWIRNVTLEQTSNCKKTDESMSLK